METFIYYLLFTMEIAKNYVGTAILFFISNMSFFLLIYIIKKNNKSRLLWIVTPSKRITQLLTKMCTALSAEGEMKANLRQQPFSVLRSLFHQPDDG